MSDTIESAALTARCGRCGDIGHDFEQCLRDASALDADGVPVQVHPNDRFMHSRVDARFSPHHQHQFPLELWQLAASYLHTQEVIPHMPLVCKYFNDEVVWGKWSGALLWREMAPSVLDAYVYKACSRAAQPSFTVLIRACCEGAPLAHVSTLLAGRPNVNTVDRRGWTALRWACERGHKDVVRKLLEAKADPNIADRAGWTPLIAASYYGHGAQIASALIASGANVNHVSDGGDTALIWACYEGRVDVVRVLVEARADVNRTDNDDGETALIRACVNTYVDVVRVLVDARADVNRTDENGDTALDWVRGCGRDDIVAMLVNAGAVRR